MGDQQVLHRPARHQFDAGLRDLCGPGGPGLADGAPEHARPDQTGPRLSPRRRHARILDEPAAVGPDPGHAGGAPAERHGLLAAHVVAARGGTSHRPGPGPRGRHRADHLERPDAASQPLGPLAELRHVPGRVPGPARRGPLLPVPQCRVPPAHRRRDRQVRRGDPAGQQPRLREGPGSGDLRLLAGGGQGGQRLRHQWPDPGVPGRRRRRRATWSSSRAPSASRPA